MVPTFTPFPTTSVTLCPVYTNLALSSHLSGPPLSLCVLFTLTLRYHHAFPDRLCQFVSCLHSPCVIITGLTFTSFWATSVNLCPVNTYLALSPRFQLSHLSRPPLSLFVLFTLTLRYHHVFPDRPCQFVSCLHLPCVFITVPTLASFPATSVTFCPVYTYLALSSRLSWPPLSLCVLLTLTLCYHHGSNSRVFPGRLCHFLSCLHLPCIIITSFPTASVNLCPVNTYLVLSSRFQLSRLSRPPLSLFVLFTLTLHYHHVFPDRLCQFVSC